MRLLVSILFLSSLGAGFTVKAMDEPAELVLNEPESLLHKIPLEVRAKELSYYLNIFKPLTEIKTELEGASITSVAVSPDAKTIVTGLTDGSVLFWDVETGKSTQTLKLGDNPLVAIAFSLEGKYLIGLSNQNVYTLWDLDKKTRRTAVRIPQEIPVEAVTSQDGEAFLFSTKNGELVLYDREKRTREPIEFKGLVVPINYTGEIASMAVDSNLHALVGGENGAVIFVDVKGNMVNEQKELMGQQGIISAVALSRDGKIALATAYKTKTATLWNTETGQILHNLVGHTTPIILAAFSPDGQFAVTGSTDGKVILWDTNTGNLFQEFTIKEGSLISIQFSPNGRLLILSTGKDLLIYENQKQRVKEAFYPQKPS